MVSLEVAKADIERWLNAAKINPKKREKNADTIEDLIDFVVDGNLTVNDEGELVQTLENAPTKQMETLKYSLRLKIGEYHKVLSGAKVAPTDVDGRLMALVASLTERMFSEVKQLDMADFKVAQTIALFFL
jgi:hypothetical protein